MTKEKKATIRSEVLDELLQGCSPLPTQEELFGPNGVIKQLSKMLIERCLQAEMTTHLGDEKNERAEEEQPNHRNGSSHKTRHLRPGASRNRHSTGSKGQLSSIVSQKVPDEFNGFQ